MLMCCCVLKTMTAAAYWMSSPGTPLLLRPGVCAMTAQHSKALSAQDVLVQGVDGDIAGFMPLVNYAFCRAVSVSPVSRYAREVSA